MKILKNILLIVVSVVLAWFLSDKFWLLYEKVFNIQVSEDMFYVYTGLAQIASGLIFGFILFTPLLFTAFGDKHKYWWAGILLLPVLWFVVKFDLAHWYFYIILAALGWLVGWGLNKLFRHRPT